MSAGLGSLLFCLLLYWLLRPEPAIPARRNAVYDLCRVSWHGWRASRRAADAPDNRGKMAMPAYGGNPSLSQQDIYDTVAYLRSVQ